MLRHERGGTNNGDIIFTSCEYAEANSFFDSESGRNDFHAYAKRMGVDKIDEVSINNIKKTVSDRTPKRNGLKILFFKDFFH